MVNDAWLTVSEVSERAGIPVDTLRRYIRVHGVHLKVKKVHKKYQIHEESMNVLQTIRELYAGSKNIDEVEQALSNKGIPMTITVETENNERMTVNVSDELKEIRQALEEQRNFNKLLLEQLETQQSRMDKQQAYIDERMNERDKQLMQGIRSIQEQKRLSIEGAEYKESMDKQLENIGKQIGNMDKQLQEFKQSLIEAATSKEEKTKKKKRFFGLF